MTPAAVVDKLAQEVAIADQIGTYREGREFPVLLSVEFAREVLALVRTMDFPRPHGVVEAEAKREGRAPELATAEGEECRVGISAPAPAFLTPPSFEFASAAFDCDECQDTKEEECPRCLGKPLRRVMKATHDSPEEWVTCPRCLGARVIDCQTCLKQ